MRRKFVLLSYLKKERSREGKDKNNRKIRKMSSSFR